MGDTAAYLHAVAEYLPSGTLSNEDLHRDYPDWSVEKIADKTGIHVRHQAAADEFTSDLAVAAAEQLFADQGLDRQDIDALIVCTQSADYAVPTTACLVQHRLQLGKQVMAFDFNLGCSGYVYGLGIAKGLIASGQARRIVLITADTYSRYIAHDDRSVRTLFGDGATASLIVAGPAEQGGSGRIGDLVYGTDGGGAVNLMVTNSGMNGQAMDERSAAPTAAARLFMDGPEIFAFTLRAVPKLLKQLWQRSGFGPDEVDRFIFHQANQYMLDHLRRKLSIPEDRFLVDMADVGNTISSTIPIVLGRALKSGRITAPQRLALVGFGVGYSWAAALIDWQ